MKRLSVPCLVIALAFYGCGSDDKDDNDSGAGGTGGSTDGGAGSGGSGGTGGTADAGPKLDANPDTANPDTNTTADTAKDTAATDATNTDVASTDVKPTDGSTDVSTDAVAAVNWTTCGTNDSKPGVSAADFCAYYMTKCGYGAGTTGTARAAGETFADMAACVARYNTYNDTKKGCAAYHVCVAGTSAGNAVTHCPHPAQVGGPCGLP